MDSQIIRHIFQEGRVSRFVKLTVFLTYSLTLTADFLLCDISANLRLHSHSLIFVIWVQNINGTGGVQKEMPL